MKGLSLFILASTFVVSSISFGEELYPCSLTAHLKNSKGMTFRNWTKNAYLSKTRSNTIEFGSEFNTTLNLKMTKDAKIEGYVNGQRNFILKDNTFESANAYGEIVCDGPSNFEAGYFFKPWKSIFVYNGPIDVIQTMNYRNTCYFGSTSVAVSEYKEAYSLTKKEISVTRKTGTINIFRLEKDCISSTGNNVDTWECIEWSEPYYKKYEVPNCDYREDDRL